MFLARAHARNFLKLSKSFYLIYLGASAEGIRSFIPEGVYTQTSIPLHSNVYSFTLKRLYLYTQTSIKNHENTFVILRVNNFK